MSNHSAVRQQMVRQKQQAAEKVLNRELDRVDAMVKKETDRIKAELEAGLDRKIDDKLDLRRMG